MRCPKCGLYNPPQYETCVSCRVKLDTASSLVQSNSTQAGNQSTMNLAPSKEKDSQTNAINWQDNISQNDELNDEPEDSDQSTASGASTHHPRRKRTVHHKFNNVLAIVAVLAIVFISAGATVFFLTRPTDGDRLLEEGRKELSLGQYAFAVRTLEQAAAKNSNNPQVFLLLARAYVGSDQIDKAWGAISEAQKLGAGLVQEPTLASDLANYYRQRKQFDRVVALIQPLAQANLPGKRAELADLEALWGDELLANGDLQRALKSWEHVKELGEGTRITEADSRLATIYQRLIDQYTAQGNDELALKYLNKMNALANNINNFERTGDIYSKHGQYDLAIDQYRNALKDSGKNTTLEHKLALALSKMGHQMLDKGETSAGFGYLQEANQYDPSIKVPGCTIKNMKLTFDQTSRKLSIHGEIWNPGPRIISTLTIKTELVDIDSRKTLWSNDTRVIDEFSPALSPNDNKPFDLTTYVPGSSNVEMKLYFDGVLYNTYPVYSKQPEAATSDQASTNPQVPSQTQSPENTDKSSQAPSSPAPLPLTNPTTSQPNSMPIPAPIIKPAPAPSKSSEEKTLDDLED